MRSMYSDEPPREVPRLALRPREAAIALGMSEKALFSRSFSRGDIPAVKVGSRTCYFVHQLQAWADKQLASQQQAAQHGGGESEADQC